MRRQRDKDGAEIIRTSVTLRDRELIEAFAAVGFKTGMPAHRLAASLVADGLARLLAEDPSVRELTDLGVEQAERRDRERRTVREHRSGFRVIQGGAG